MTDSLQPVQDDQFHAFTVELLRILESSFSLDELRTLCFEVDVEFDDLGGEGRAGKARERPKIAHRPEFLPQDQKPP